MSLSPAERLLLERRLTRQRYAASPLHGAAGLALVALVGLPLLALVLAGAGVGVVYAALADELGVGIDRIQSLDQRQSLESTRIYDRNGVLLRQILVKDLGRRTYMPLSEIPQTVRQATIAVEDKNFYTNPGVEPTGILRAVSGELRGERTAGGGSTITQQFVRHVAFSYEERIARSYTRKLKELVLALIITRQHSKDQILEWYLNEIFYGNRAYGIEAAAQTVFGKSARELDLAESALLAALPQLPGSLDPLNPDPDVQQRVRDRQQVVLDLMAANDFISGADAAAAAAEELVYKEPDDDLFLAPHFVVYVEDVLEELFGAERWARGGLEVTTTLDYSLQALGERLVRENVEKLRDRHHLTNGALVALEPRSGQVLAMVGSADYWNVDIRGKYNVAVAPRQPGSSIKPITYATALEDGLPTSTFLWDVRMELWTPGGLYRPPNFDEEFHGPVRLRAALANSYNIPALKLLLAMGAPDNALAGVAKTIDTAHRMGITGLNNEPEHYGISLTLGGGEVTLLDMTTAYATLSNRGELVRPHPVLRVTDSSGAELYDLMKDDAALTAVAAVDPAVAYIITDILSDNEARTPAFGSSSKLNIGVPAAVKTGTTNNNLDNWTVGYTPYLSVGAWAGNSDNSAMVGTSGLTGAAPIWNAFMRGIVEDAEKRAIVRRARESFGFDYRTDFERPDEVIEATICRLASLKEVASGCPALDTELFTKKMLAGPVPAGPAAPAGAGGGQVVPLGYAPDVWQLVPAAVIPFPPPPEELIQAAAAEGKPVRWPRAHLCRPAGPGYGDEKAQPVAVLPLPPDEGNRLSESERTFVLEWAQENGWAALEPAEPCTPEMAAAALEPGSLVAGFSAGALSGLFDLPGLSFSQTEYRLNLAPNAVLTTTTLLTGTVTYDPARIEYFKVELGRGLEPTEWITLGDIHHGPVVDGRLEVLDAPSLPPGDYIVRLVLVKNDGNFLSPPYAVPIRVGR